MTFSRAIGLVMSSILLTILWAIVFGIYALIIKIISLLKGPGPDPKSHWISVKNNAPNDYRNQF